MPKITEPARKAQRASAVVKEDFRPTTDIFWQSEYTDCERPLAKYKINRANVSRGEKSSDEKPPESA